jgi:sulfate adenylyltransferase subunit 2
VVPLYFAAERPVVERDGGCCWWTTSACPLRAGEVPSLRKVRFRTLGCYPLTGAIESDADTLERSSRRCWWRAVRSGRAG